MLPTISTENPILKTTLDALVRPIRHIVYRHRTITLQALPALFGSVDMSGGREIENRPTFYCLLNIPNCYLRSFRGNIFGEYPLKMSGINNAHMHFLVLGLFCKYTAV